MNKLLKNLFALLMLVAAFNVFAAADLEVNTPGVNAVKASMQNRHAQLAPYYDSGAVGFSFDGMIILRDAWEALLAAAQDRGVAAFQAEDGAVDGDVGARFVDDADDADGNADLANAQAVGACAFIEQCADGIGQGGDLADGGGEVAQTFLVRRQHRYARGRSERRGFG